jgi:GNAT superfamily N-acetyltransferase
MSTTTAPAGHHRHDDVVLVPFGEQHLPGALRLSQEMSWPYRLEDWAIAMELGRGLVLQGGDGSVVGTAGWWPYGEDHASAGMIIVTQAAQGRGYGARLMDALLAAAQARTLTLNATAEGLALYERRGFVRTGLIQQHQGVLQGRHVAPAAKVVRAMDASDDAAVSQLDLQATGWHRRPMLRRLLEAGEGHVLHRDGEARGFAISRRFGRGHVIGPVVADSVDDARALIEAALARLDGMFVRVDTSAASGLGGWLEHIGLPQVGDAITMVRGPRKPPTGPARMFALANQSFN